MKEAMDLAGEVAARLKKLPEVKRISPAGSLRRMKETVRDIDILAHGDTKASVLTNDGVQIDVRVEAALKGKLTGRILKAIDSGYANIIAHPTGRLDLDDINSRASLTPWRLV